MPRQGGRPPGGRWRTSSVDGDADQDVFDGDQPSDVRAYWIAQLCARPKEVAVALRPADLEHIGVQRVEGAPAQGHLDHAAEPRGVERNLLRQIGRASCRERGAIPGTALYGRKQEK